MSYIQNNGGTISANTITTPATTGVVPYPNVTYTPYTYTSSYTSYANNVSVPEGYFHVFVSSYFDNRLLTDYNINKIKDDMGNLLRRETNEWLEDKHDNFNIVSAYNEFKTCSIEYKIFLDKTTEVTINDEIFHYMDVNYFFMCKNNNFNVKAKLLVSHKEFLKLKLSS